MTLALIELGDRDLTLNDLDWMAQRMAGLLGSENPWIEGAPVGGKWVLGPANNYWLHLEGRRTVRITSRYPLPAEVVDAIKVILVAVWGLTLKQQEDPHAR